MFNINTDLINGTIAITDSWTLTATGASAAPTFLSNNDEFVVSFVDLEGVDKFKSFTFSATNQTETRYLTSEYRVSRDARKWTQWLTLDTNITNFPPFTPTDKMFLDLRIKRSGTSGIGTIKLLSYGLFGSLDRELQSGDSPFVVSAGNPVVIKPPYIYKVFKITDIEILSSNNDSLSTKWRYSQDYGRTVTQWEPFTKENATTAKITPIRFFQVEYLMETTSTTPIKVWDINLIGDFQNVSEDYKKTNLYGVRENCNCIKLGLVNDPTGSNQYPTGGNSTMLMPNEKRDLYRLSDDDKNKLFKPYQLNEATNLLNKLSVEANEVFGHEVVYFLTDPDRKGIDHSFHEYQLYNIVCNDLIKVSVENNKFPDNQIKINQFDLSLFETFEIHIPKESFKSVFGPEKRPGKEDFIWFCEINRMFLVEHAQPFRSFNNNSIYYRVMLKKYSQKSNVIGVNETITDKVKELTKNSTIDELFGLENNEDKAAVANKEQNTPLTLDTLRVDILAAIEREVINNAEIIISKNHYDLSSVGFGVTQSTDAVIYRNMKREFLKSDNLSFICWFKINNWVVNDIYRVFDYYDTPNSQGLQITINNNKFKVRINSTDYEMNLNRGLAEEVWYSYLVNIDQRQRKIEQFIYKRDVEDEEEAEFLSSTKLDMVYRKDLPLTPSEFIVESDNAKLMGCDMRITNIRLFSDVIAQKEHNKILNQNIIRDDASHLIFADNANQQIVLPNFPTSQIPPGSVGYARQR